MATTFRQKKNNAKSTITNNPLTAGGLSITLASSTGSRFPTTGATWIATIWDAVTYADPSDDSNMEVVLIDSRSTDTLTVNASGRGYAGTTGVSHATGSAIRLLIMKEHMTEYETAINTLEAASVGTYTAPATFTPTWTNTGTANSIGSGTITGRYTQTGKRMHINITLTIAADTTTGNGVWIFGNFPVASISSGVMGGSAHYFDANGVSCPGSIAAASTTTCKVPITGGTAPTTGMGGNGVPVAAIGNGDYLELYITYEVV